MLPVLFLRPPHRVVGKGGGCVNGKKILSVLFGALTSLGIFLLLALVLTWLVTREMLPVGQAPKAVWAALALAALLGALLAEIQVWLRRWCSFWCCSAARHCSSAGNMQDSWAMASASWPGDWPPDCWEPGRKSPENTGEKITSLVKLYKKEQGVNCFYPLREKCRMSCKTHI